MRYWLAFLLCMYGFVSFSQENESTVLTAKEIAEIKQKEEGYWYVDASPPKRDRGYATSQGGEYGEDETSETETKKMKKSKQDSAFLDAFLVFMKWLLIAVFALGILYLLLKSKLPNFSKLFARNTKIDNVIIEDTKIESEEQLKNIGYEEQIKRAEANGNYRLATRLYYLWVLKKLIEAGIVRFNINKTNQDYCSEVRNHKFYEDFSECTRYYDYVWFGEFAVDAQGYDFIKNKFKNLLEKPL